jgi:hypothetical protein
VRRPADTEVDLVEPELDDAEVVISGMFETARARAAATPAPEEPIELSVSDVEVVKFTRDEEPEELSVSDAEVVKFMCEQGIDVGPRPPPPPREEPVELSVSDAEVVKFLPPPRRPEPTNPCIAFERTFAAEFARTISPANVVKPRILRFAPPPRVRQVYALGDGAPIPMPAMPRASAAMASVPDVPRRRRSLIPRATLLMGLVVLGGVVSEQAKAGRFDHVTRAALAWIDSALGQ